MASIEDLLIPEIFDAFIESVQNIVDKSIISEMTKAIENNDLDALVRASGFTPAMLNPILDTIESGYEKAAASVVSQWPKVIPTSFGNISFVFNMRNPAV